MPNQNDSPSPVQSVVASRRAPKSTAVNCRGGFLQTLGLDVRAAALTFIVDLLIFGSDTLSFGIMVPAGIAAAAVLGLIVYRIQRNWYGDNHNSALVKALTIALLTALPVPITSVLAIPRRARGPDGDISAEVARL